MSAYQIVNKKDSRKIADLLAEHAELLEPVLAMLDTAETSVNVAIDAIGRVGIEALLLLSAKQVVGGKQPGKKRSDSDIRWYGYQNGFISLDERKLRVERPRLRKKGRHPKAEVAIPVYETLQTNRSVAQRVLQILLNGVSTRSYREVLPAMAESVGMSKSSVSREMIDGCEEQLREICERRFDTIPLLVIYIDGVQLGKWHVIVAVGVDAMGEKHVLGLREGATENATTVGKLLEDLVERGVKPDRHRLFVIDGSKALHSAIRKVYGATLPIQRCHKHKERNVVDELPKDQVDLVTSKMRSAWKLRADEGEKKLEELAKSLEKEHPSAAASLREGLSEMFTINRMGLSLTLRRCLETTNVIESTFSGVSVRTHRVRHWQDGSMAVRWAASTLLATEKHYKKLMGYRDLWQLKAYLDELDVKHGLVSAKKVG
jgi:transposase-like protein